MSETPRPTPPCTEKIELIRNRIMRLYEAHLCQSERIHLYFDADHQCNTSQCNTVLLLLRHIGNCWANNCFFPFCSSTRETVSHWKDCNEENCAECLPLNQADWHPFTFNPAEVTPTTVQPMTQSEKRSALELRRAHDALGIQCPPTGRGGQREPSAEALLERYFTPLRPKRDGANIVGQSSQVGFLDEQAQPGPCEGAVPIVASIQLMQDIAIEAANDQQSGAGPSVGAGQPSASIHLPFANILDSTTGAANGLQSGAFGGTENRQGMEYQQAGPSTDTPVQGPQRWRQYVTPGVRDHLVRDMIREILPNIGRLTALDLRVQSIVAFLRKVEAHSYEIASSRSDYYRLLKEEMHLMRIRR